MNPQDLYQLGYFGLLLSLAIWVRSHIKSVGDECKADKESLLKELTSTREQYIKALTSTIERDNASRDRATSVQEKTEQSLVMLTKAVNSLPCGKWGDGKTERRSA